MSGPENISAISSQQQIRNRYIAQVLKTAAVAYNPGMHDSNTEKLLVVTGLSGSGKSIALNVLEDCGYNCIDNLPVSLFETLVSERKTHPDSHKGLMAIGIDARTQSHDLDKVPALAKQLQDAGIECEIIFLDASNDILIQRFSETRRRHPLTDDQHNLESAIDLERELLESLKSAARLTLDTSHTSLHELRNIISHRVAERRSGELSVMIQSFGFKHGMPNNANFVFDARCLPNPYWQPSLRALTGRDQGVIDFLEHELKVTAMFSHISDFITQWIPCFEQEGRSYLTIAIGCTGGQHRSVYLSERLRQHFEAQGRDVLLTHRELS